MPVDKNPKQIVDNVNPVCRFSAAVLRKKWKYLRDQFAVEIGKAKPAKSGAAAGSVYVPKWCYYESLLFLKDIVKSRPPSSNVRRSRRDSVDIQDDEEFIQEQDPEPDRDTENSEVLEDGSVAEQEVDNIPSAQNQAPSFLRLIPTNSKHNENILLLEQKKAQVVQREPESDDMMFFKSLLPFVQNIPSNRKLRFRSKILDIVDEFSSDNTPTSWTSAHYVTTPSAVVHIFFCKKHNLLL